MSLARILTFIWNDTIRALWNVKSALFFEALFKFYLPFQFKCELRAVRYEL